MTDDEEAKLQQFIDDYWARRADDAEREREELAVSASTQTTGGVTSAR